MLWYFDSLMGVRIVKNRFIRKISLIFIIMLFLIGMSYTIVNAAATERTISKMDGMEWFIPVGALEEVSAEDSSGTDSGEPLVNGGDKVLITTNPNMENATNLTDMSITSNLDKYENNGVEGADALRNKSNVVVGVLQAVGTVVAVIMLTIIAIKYMISSIEERAEYKQTMVPYIIGAASILIISNLVGLIYSIITNLNI